MAVLEPAEPLWVAVLRAAAPEVRAALSGALGPIRARSVVVAVDARVVRVTIDSGDPDLDTVVWWTCVELSDLWPATFNGDEVGLEVAVNGRTTTVPHAVMIGTADGWDRGRWRAELSRR